jgi:hypothetical protein
MTESSTATVETLTAEVRVLMVGNRQITTSVAKQLDTVPLDKLKPFGRVRMSDGQIWVIGSRVEDGTLVIANPLMHFETVARVWIHDKDEIAQWESLGFSRAYSDDLHVLMRRPISDSLRQQAMILPLIVLAGLR